MTAKIIKLFPGADPLPRSKTFEQLVNEVQLFQPVLERYARGVAAAIEADMRSKASPAFRAAAFQVALDEAGVLAMNAIFDILDEI
jgi:hypothetical protein